MHHGKHEDVDVRLPELPVGPVNGQLQRAFYWKQPENESCDKVRIKRMFGIIRWLSKCNGKTCFAIAEREAFGRKPTELDSPQTWVRLGFGVKTGRQLGETHRPGLAQGCYKKRQELYVRQVDVFSEETG